MLLGGGNPMIYAYIIQEGKDPSSVICSAPFKLAIVIRLADFDLGSVLDLKGKECQDSTVVKNKHVKK